jgi:hypothetical protein
MKQADRIKELERRLSELEAREALRMYPVYVPYYVYPHPVVAPTPAPTWPSYPWGPWISTTNVTDASATQMPTVASVSGSTYTVNA